VARALVLAKPPSMSDGELTAKGSINARRVLTLRMELLERLYDNDDPAVVRV
jgi:feruloyl-CoA synthase